MIVSGEAELNLIEHVSRSFLESNHWVSTLDTALHPEQRLLPSAPIAKLPRQSIVPPSYPPVFAALWRWLIAPVIMLVITTLPWSLFLVGAYLTARLLDGLLTQNFTRRHEPGYDHD